MAKARKPPAKTEPGRVSKKMAGVRPLRGTPAIRRRYDPGFPKPPGKDDPWRDSGRPEING